MTAKQYEHKTPKQFLYRMIELKQRVIFTSKRANADIKYEVLTAQNVFVHTLYQGFSEKHNGIRLELKLLSDPTVTDEALLRQVTKTSEESERKRRLGHSTHPRTVHAQSTEASSRDENTEKCVDDPSNKQIHQLCT